MADTHGPGFERLTAAGALLARLKALGVDYVFANSGTDFPPIIEGLAEAAAKGIALPQALVMPHESAAMGMAHGYFLATGRGQAVIAHTNVGLANCAIGAINAAVERVPILLFSGRTPTTERDRLGGNDHGRRETGRGMKHAAWPAGGPGREEDEHRRIGRDRAPTVAAGT